MIRTQSYDGGSDFFVNFVVKTNGNHGVTALPEYSISSSILRMRFSLSLADAPCSD